MKILTSLLFLFLYTFSIFRPLVPYLDYYFNYDYITKVLCINKDKPEKRCNGKCHLAMELKKTNDDIPQSQQTPRAGLEQTKLSEALLNFLDNNPSPERGKASFYSYEQNSINQFFKKIPVPPPRLSC